MLTLSTKIRISLCAECVDMRKSFDGLIGVIRNHLGDNPLAGDWFVFLNRSANRVKILYWDGDGFVYRFHGNFSLPPPVTFGNWGSF